MTVSIERLTAGKSVSIAQEGPDGEGLYCTFGFSGNGGGVRGRGELIGLRRVDLV